jgi:hypothetical protein
MNYFKFLRILSFLTVGCLIFNMVGCSSLLTKDSLLSSQLEKKILLEILSDGDAGNFPQGKILEFRIFDDRSVEFDNRPSRKQTEKKRLTSTLGEEDFEVILSILDSPDLLNSKDEYGPRRISPMSVDSQIKTKVSISKGDQMKVIVLNENDSFLYLDTVPSYVKARDSEYPTSLVKLLKVVSEVKEKL